MDGNGRWARARGLARASGHRAGAAAVRRTVDCCARWGVPYLTLYAFSTENWNRPPAEVNALMRLLGQFLRREADSLAGAGVRLRVLGDPSRLPPRLRRELDRVTEQLAGGRRLTLSIALNYGGRDELTRAFRRLLARGIPPEAVDEAAVSAALDTAGLPDPDLVIRTAGEERLSNFLIWQAAYAEYYSEPRCWPDFGPEALAEAFRAYQARARKFGGV